MKKSIFFHLVLAASAFALRAEVDRDLLLGLLRIPSVTMDQEQNNRAVHYLKGWFDAHGVFTAVETNEAGRGACDTKGNVAVIMDGAEKMKSFLEATTGLEVILPKTWRRPVITDPENLYVRTLHAAMRRTWPDREIPLTRMSCATDATRYAHLSLPTVIFGATGYGAHAKDERVSLASLDAYEAMFTAFLAEIESIESK